MIHLTPTERRLFNILRDGEYHSKQELMTALEDGIEDLPNLRLRIHHLRNKLKRIGINLACVFGGKKSSSYIMFKPSVIELT